MNLSQSKDLSIKTSNIVWKNVADNHTKNYKSTRINTAAALNSYSNIYDIYTLLGSSLSILQESANYLEYYFENR